MQKRLLYFLCLLGSNLWYVACQKEPRPISTLSATSNATKNKTILIDGRSNQQKVGNTDEIIVGNKLPNPYAHDNVLAAFNTIYPNQSRNSLPITHVYLKLLPSSWEALKHLQEIINGLETQNNSKEAHDPYLFAYPIHKEILQQGIYYHDPNIPTDVPSYHYVVVPPDFQVPAGTTSEILAELIQVPYNTYIMAEAFRRVGADYYGVDGVLLDDCTPSCANYPQCFDPAVECNGGNVEPLPVPCDPNGTWWYHCNQLFIPTPLNPTGGSTNSCGCYMPEEQNKPSGCVQVEDTQLGWEGVRNIKVYVKDLYFFGRATWTTHSGCWSIDHQYFGGMHPFVDWYNSKVEFRAMRGVYTPQLAQVLQQNCGTHGGGIYHDFQIRHYRFTDNSKIERAHWVASTGLNALYEFDNYALQEGIGGTNGSPRTLRVWLLNQTGGASAPMLKDLVWSPIGNTAVNLGANFIGVRILPSINANVPSIRNFLPDVTLSYGSSSLRSDNMKVTYYHEYAHVAHYRGLPSSTRHSYWTDNIVRILDNVATNDNPPYGSPNTTGAGRTAIMEAWATHIGLLFADKQYGENCELSKRQPDQIESKKARYIYRSPFGLEPFNTNSSDANAWMPEGIFWDLWDDQVHNGFPLYVSEPIRDNVQGVSNQLMFNAITQGTPTEFVTVKNALKSNWNGNTAEIDSLFLEYGY
ncbi:MAG: hypothetical protein AB8E82_12250 [Aureispira sp.]